MVGPTADSVEPRLEQFELVVPELGIEFLQEERGGYFFFQHRSGKKLIGNVHEEIESELFSNLPPETSRRPAQVGGVPAMRLDLIFEEPLHAGGVLGRSAVFQRLADLRGDLCGSGVA